MTERGRPRTMLRNRPRRDLYYDGIRLVPFTSHVSGRVVANLWCLPGGECTTTTELIRRANLHGVDIVMHERKGAHVRITRLN